MSDYKNQIEAILFSSGRVMDADMLVKLTGASSKRIIADNIKRLIEEYEERKSPIMIVEEKNGWKMAVRETYLGLVRMIVSDTELPKTILETLAIIAWGAPILQSKVVDVRHNKAYDHIKELLDLGFITKEQYGRSYIIKLTNKFFNYFEVEGSREIRELFKGIKEKREQKKVEEFEDNKKQEGLEVYSVPIENAQIGTDDDVERVGKLEVYDEPIGNQEDNEIVGSGEENAVFEAELGELESYGEGTGEDSESLIDNNIYDESTTMNDDLADTKTKDFFEDDELDKGKKPLTDRSYLDLDNEESSKPDIEKNKEKNKEEELISM